MPIWLQHLVVVLLASAFAIGIVVRRLRALSGRGPLCDGCAKGCDDPTRRDREACAPDGRTSPIPVRALLRRRDARLASTPR